jgi:hypothetical protein
MKRRFSWHFDLSLDYDPRVGRGLLVLAMLLATAGDLASENVTLTTYYPAPSGVYSQMITTGNTYLARDGGSVGVGTTAPGGKLDVQGMTYLSQLQTTGNNVVNTGNPNAADIVIGSSADGGARHDSSMMFWSNASASRIFGQNDVFYLSTWNQPAVGGANVALAAGLGGTSSFNGALNVNSGNLSVRGGNLSVGPAGAATTNRGYVYIDNTNTSCYETDEVGDVWGTACPGSYYITQQPGLYVGGWAYYNRGGQTLVQTGAGQASTQVWGLNNCSGGGVGCSGNPQWMTLKKDDASMHVFCCLK